MTEPDPLARTAASERRLWKPQSVPVVKAGGRETYPFEVPVIKDGRPRLFLLCRARFQIVKVELEALGTGFRIRMLIHWLDRATMEVRATVREVYSRDVLAAQHLAARLGNSMVYATYAQLTRQGLTHAAYERLCGSVRGENIDHGESISEASTEEGSQGEEQQGSEGTDQAEAGWVPEADQ